MRLGVAAATVGPTSTVWPSLSLKFKLSIVPLQLKIVMMKDLMRLGTHLQIWNRSGKTERRKPTVFSQSEH